MKDQYRSSVSKEYIIFVLTIAFVLVTIVVGAFVFRFYKLGVQGGADVREYDRYYCLIADNYKSDFWKEVYKGAFEKAQEENIYVELLMSIYMVIHFGIIDIYH